MESADKTILVIEDNELNMRLFCDILEAHNYRALRASTGQEGIDMVHANHPDLILMDIQLPDISGLDTMREIRKHSALNTIPIVALTAFAMKDDMEKLLEEGFQGWISKPISVPKFLSTIGNILTNPSKVADGATS